MKKVKWLMILIIGAFTLSGCVPLVVGGAAVTGGSGAYFYINGELKTDYHYSFDKSWSACEKTVAYMNATDVMPVKEISKGTINAVIDGEKVHFVVEYKAKNLTAVAIRVGMLGNKSASQRLHDKVVDYLLK
jgi:osmotically-inducible protein OsmY